MPNLWAPWRMAYIGDKDRTKSAKGDCVFCDLLSQEKSSKNLVLCSSDKGFVVMNKFPYNTGHLLILPKSHTANLQDLSSDVHTDLMSLMSESLKILKKHLKADGFNCGINQGASSGGGIPDHLHWHVVPRWAGDTNFLPVLADTRALPEYLEETYNKIAADFQNLNR